MLELKNEISWFVRSVTFQPSERWLCSTGGVTETQIELFQLGGRGSTLHLRGNNDENHSFFRKLPHFDYPKLHPCGVRGHKILYGGFSTQNQLSRWVWSKFKIFFFFFHLPQCTFMHIGRANVVHSHANGVEKVYLCSIKCDEWSVLIFLTMLLLLQLVEIFIVLI